MSSREANEQRIAVMTEAELHDIMDRAAAYAYYLVAQKSWRFGKSGLLPGGRTVDDLVQAAFENILKGGKWDSEKDLCLVMKGFIRGTVGNLVISWEHRNISNIEREDSNQDGDWCSAIEQISSGDPTPVEKIIRSEDDDLILEIVDGLKEGSPERQIADSILNGASKRAEVLDEIGLSAEEYEAAKKRLRRFLENYRQKREVAHQ